MQEPDRIPDPEEAALIAKLSAAMGEYAPRPGPRPSRPAARPTSIDIFRKIDRDDVTDAEKFQAVEIMATAGRRESVSKNQMWRVIRWLLAHCRAAQARRTLPPLADKLAAAKDGKI